MRPPRHVAYQCVSLSRFIQILQLLTAFMLYSQPLLSSGDGPIALVLAPTRELAVRIQQECTKFGRAPLLSSSLFNLLIFIVAQILVSAILRFMVALPRP